MMCLLTSTNSYTPPSAVASSAPQVQNGAQPPPPPGDASPNINQDNTKKDGEESDPLFETPPSSHAGDDSPGSASPESSDSSCVIAAKAASKLFCDPSSENSVQEDIIPAEETPPESPTKGWRRLLVKSTSTWSFHFVSPDGTRFESHEELTEHLKAKSEKFAESDLDFLRRERDLKVVVPVTFCNMRQNIFDIRKKRGRKKSRDTRRNSISNTKQALAAAKRAAREMAESEPLNNEEEVAKLPKIDESTTTLDPIEEKTLPLTINCSTTTTTTSILHSILTSPLKSRKRKASAELEQDKVISPILCDASAEPDDDDDEPGVAHDEDDVRDPLGFDDGEEITGKRVEPPPNLLMIKPDRPISADLLEFPQESFKLSNDLHKDGCEDEIASCFYEDDDEETPLMETDKDPMMFSPPSSPFARTPSTVSTSLHSFRRKKCSVPMVDIFRSSPLSSFICYGCSKPYAAQNDFTVDIRCQTIWITCVHCQWWTCRKITTSPPQSSFDSTDESGDEDFDEDDDDDDGRNSS